MLTRVDEDYLAALAISDMRYDKASRSYPSLGAWLHRPQPTVLAYNPQVHAQGSFRLSTAIRQPCDDEEYNGDSVFILETLGADDLSQKQLKTLAGNEIKAYQRSQNMVKPMQGGRRCRIAVANETGTFNDL
ncbi:hypothetical protein W822_01550 [Advenella kashmirensis W13003]|uniref:Uncharacterized protein n=1 Tax=Advenella kashmirensis W13003 TaxID=1424334 RepID=V8QXK9_9BURK|nr:hypothetical protein [Advenella kashmirensis]ETF04651.1 hypothetical protein W822_01550 [Advenella kashmirensis W13003]